MGQRRNIEIIYRGLGVNRGQVGGYDLGGNEALI